MAVVAVTGFMGSGKSLVGRKAAERLGWRFIDLDEHVEREEGRPIAEIFEAGGEEAFRRAEYRSLQELLGGGAPEENIVLSLGGGTLGNPDLVPLVREHAFVVYLDTPVDICWDRVAGDPDRPLAAKHAPFHELAAQRQQSYVSAADVVIEAESRGADDLAREITVMASALVEEDGQ